MTLSRTAARALTLSLLMLLIMPPAGAGPSTAVDRPSRAASMVHFDIFSTRLRSDKVSGWEGFMVGLVNGTTFIETSLVNDLEVPLTGVEVTCTSYWYEGNYPDRGHIMFREMVLVDLPSGKGSTSPKITFRWTPTISGSYIINVSAHVPGDARPMSTDPIFFQGRKYEQEKQGYFYSGVWVSRNYWDCSSMDGWEASTKDGDPTLGWRPVEHPLGATPDLQHSAPWTFWAGSDFDWTAPPNGTYSLTSPELSLEGFSPNPYDIEIGTRRPQIYLIYRYRGNITPAEGSRGRVDLWISTDGGAIWAPLNDSRGSQVVISGGTPTGYWGYASRPPALGSNRLIGIDLGGYIGHRIRLRFDLTPSGINETGILIDDIALMGIERLEERPFIIGPPLENGIDVEPSGSATFHIPVSTTKWNDHLALRFAAVNASHQISPERDITVEPEVLRMGPGSIVQTTITVNVSIPKGALSGSGRVMLRGVGGGHYQDVELTFYVRPIHRVGSRLEGLSNGPIEPGTPISMTVHIENTGNIKERVEVTFVTASDLRWDRPRWSGPMDPGKEAALSGNLTVRKGSPSGSKDGFFVVSPLVLPPDSEVLSKVLSGEPMTDWYVHQVSYVSKQFHDIYLVSTGTSQYIDGPPSEGTQELTYNLFLVNRGNGEELVHFLSHDTGSKESIEVVLPQKMTMKANDSKVVDVLIKVEFPLPEGIYNFTIRAVPTGDDDPRDNMVELFLVVGRPPVSQGIFLLNGSLQVRPENVVMGQETILFFKARSFGYLQPVPFTVNLFLDGIQIDSGVFLSSLSGTKEYQFTFRFQDRGTREVSVAIAGTAQAPTPGGDLRRALNITITVRSIEIAVEDVGLDGLFGQALNRTFAPREHDIQAIIRNLGDSPAELVTVQITVLEVSESQNRTVASVNVSDLDPGVPVVVTHRFRSFSPGTQYHITVAFQDRGTWRDANTTNDLRSIVVVIGDREPPVPFWRGALFLYISAGTLVLALMVVAYLLIRREL